MRDVECVLLLFAEHRSLKKANNKKAANNRRHLGQEKPRALFGCDQRFLREDSPVIPVIYDIQNSMLPSFPLLQVKYRNNFPFLVARVLKFGPETIYLVLNMAIFLANIVFKHYHHNLTLKISSDRTRFSFMSAHLKAKKKKVVFNVVRQLTLASRLLVKQRLQLLFKT